jgi:LysR family transcriptional regulator for bpeEF and oprC
MTVFARVVQARSFSKAAETLELPRSAVTATVQRLEAHLQTRLLQRTTRRVSPTPEGEEYYLRCVEILAAVEQVDESLRELSTRQPRGTLRIDMPGALARNLVLPRLGEFRAAYPDIKLALSLNNRVTDLALEGMDCALRVGQLQDSTLIGRPLGNMRFVTCASPAYLSRRGTPRTIDDLAQHDLVVYFSGRTGRPLDWDFVVGAGLVKIDVNSTVSVNDPEANVVCGLTGLGLIQAGAYQVRSYLADGSLVEVLAESRPAPLPVSLLYPFKRLAPPKLRVFSEWVTQLFSTNPDFA